MDSSQVAGTPHQVMAKIRIINAVLLECEIERILCHQLI